MNNNSNKLLLQCGIFTGVVCAFFIILSLFIVASRKNWENGLKQAVWNVLPIEEYSLGGMVQLDEKNDEVACYRMSKKSGQEEGADNMALVMRITTYYGPMPAVFVYENGETRFLGIAYLKSSIANEFKQASYDRQMLFWTNRAEKIFEKAQQTVGEL